MNCPPNIELLATYPFVAEFPIFPPNELDAEVVGVIPFKFAWINFEATFLRFKKIYFSS